MYSKKLVELARSVDRMEMSLAFARHDLEQALLDAHPDNTDEQDKRLWEIPNKYFRGLDEAIGMIYGQFVEQLSVESQPHGGIALANGRIIFPEWVSTLMNVVHECEYFTEDRVRELVTEGFKVVHVGPGWKGQFDNVTVFAKEVPDSVIEVWWSRWASFEAIGRHGDIRGFLDQVEGLGWQAFIREQ